MLIITCTTCKISNSKITSNKIFALTNKKLLKKMAVPELSVHV